MCYNPSCLGHDIAGKFLFPEKEYFMGNCPIVCCYGLPRHDLSNHEVGDGTFALEVEVTVYFINELGGNCCIKIGYTDGDPAVRLNDLSTGNSSELSIFGELPEGTPQLERMLHRHFRTYRARGEWFDFNGREDELEALMYDWVWPHDTDGLTEHLASIHTATRRVRKAPSATPEDKPGWRVEKRYYTKRDGAVSEYRNYRSRQSRVVNGKRKIAYRNPQKTAVEVKP